MNAMNNVVVTIIHHVRVNLNLIFIFIRNENLM